MAARRRRKLRGERIRRSASATSTTPGLPNDAPQEVVYPRQACGIENDAAIGMGLSWGWMDIYDSRLPGQSIDVTAVRDGKYRLWVEVDVKRWFQEERRDNNVTWADLEIVTEADGSRDVRNVRSGPPIRLSD